MSGSYVRRHQLGRILAGYRDKVGLNQKAAGALLGRSQAFVCQVERGTHGIRTPDLEFLLRRYGVTDEATIAKLVEFSESAGQRGWYNTLGLPDDLADHAGLEQAANRLCAFEIELVPGLLQTPEYARELHILRGSVPPGQVSARVDARVRRQELLTSRRPPALTVVMSESALARCAAPGDEVGTGQLRFLWERAQLPNVEVRVLPFAVGRHAAIQGSFTLMEFPPGLLLPMVAWQEHAQAGHLIDDESAVADLARLFGEVRRLAFGVDESLALIADLAANHS